MHTVTIWLTVRPDMTVASLKDMVSCGGGGSGRGTLKGTIRAHVPHFAYTSLYSGPPFPLPLSPCPRRYSWTTAFHLSYSSGSLGSGWPGTRRPCTPMGCGGTGTAPTSICCQRATPHLTLRNCSGRGSCGCWKVRSASEWPLRSQGKREQSPWALGQSPSPGGPDP